MSKLEKMAYELGRKHATEGKESIVKWSAYVTLGTYYLMGYYEC
jgi:hypothetical protein